MYHGDCREILPQLEAESVDLVLTDPPYSSGARRDAERQVRGAMLRTFEDENWFSHDTMTSWGFSWFIRSIFSEMKRILLSGCHIYVFSDWRQTPNVYGLLESCGFRVNHCLVWDKGHFGMGTYWRNQHENIIFASAGMPNTMINRGMGSILCCPRVPREQRSHPTEKPVKLLSSIISAVPGTLILDPFMGSGTTVVAAQSLGRKAIGIEIEERYCQIAVDRLAQMPLPLTDTMSHDIIQEKQGELLNDSLTNRRDKA